MSATVCQNIVFSCFEPQIMAETAAAAAENWVCGRIFCDDPTNGRGSPEDCGFLYADHLSEKSLSVSRLSARSLEMCTENLGSETGTDTITDGGGDSIFSSSVSCFDRENSWSSKGGDQERSRINRGRQPRNEEAGSCRRFPPPLTTMSGTGSIEVRRHCEGGRLIIEAVERPLRNSYLQAERSDGRLRLCYMTDSESDSDIEAAAEEEEEDAGAGLESGTEEFGFQRLRRCNENGGLCSNWKPAFWVATS